MAFILTMPNGTLWEWDGATLACTSPVLERLATVRLGQVGGLPASPVGPWYEAGTDEAALLAAEWAMRHLAEPGAEISYTAEGDVPRIQIPASPPGAIA